MGGSVIISSGVGVAMCSFDFDDIVERIRSELDAEGLVITKRIYEPLDDEGMDFISLRETDDTAFAYFVRAARRARVLAEARESYPRRRDAWEELIMKLEADPRCLARH